MGNPPAIVETRFPRICRTTETNIGLIRGIKAAADNGADLINYSYGESVKDLAKNENASIVSQTLKQFANKHGGLFVTSAGNSGPGLSSIAQCGKCEMSEIGE